MSEIKFNKDQKEAIEFKDGAAGIVAAAGSGKTVLLLERVNNLIREHKVPEKELLVISFTRNVGNELKKKLTESGHPFVNVGTFHSVCGQILNKEGININPSKLIQDWQVDNCFRQIDQEADSKDIINFISYQKSHMIGTDDEFVNKESDYSFSQLRTFYKAYENFKKKKRLYDFDDYLLICLDIVRKNPDKHTFDYILVDEHQDSNKVQNLLLKEWTKSGNVFTVFDYRQCFTPNTPVNTPGGYKKIKDVVQGDEVKVASGHGRTTDYNVSEVMVKNYAGRMVELGTKSGNVIQATPEHTVFLGSSNTSYTHNKTRGLSEKGVEFTLFDTSQGSHSVKVNSRNEQFTKDFANAWNIDTEEKVLASNNMHFNQHTNNHDGAVNSINKLIDNHKESDSKVKLVSKAILTEDQKDFYYMPIDEAMVGMTIPFYKDGAIIEDEIIYTRNYSYEGLVYDLNIDNYRNYIANDIVVHNCIYSFRGGDPDYAMNFDKHWDNATIMNVHTNYRSPKNIVDKSNEFIKQYYGEYEHYKDAKANRQSDGFIEVNSYVSRPQEADEVANKVQNLIDNGAELNEIAILYRNNKHADFLENQFKRRKIDYEIANNSSFFKRREISGILSILRLTQDTDDDNAFEGAFRLRAEPLKYFSNVILSDIKTHAKEEGNSLFESLNEVSLPQSWQKINVKKFRGMINVLQDMLSDGTDIEDMIDYIVSKFKIKSLIKEKYSNADERDERMASLEILKSFTKDNDLEQFINYVYTSSDKKKKKEHAVKMMTIHRSKGLEYDNVLVIGVEDGEFPSERDGAMNNIEEEARLFYVAVSRSKENLWVSEIGKGNRFIQEYNESDI